MQDAFCEHLPPVDLAGHVDRFWTLHDRQGQHGQRVLPDGCVDILIGLGDDAQCSVVGTMTTALVVPPGPQHVIAVRMRPGAAARVLGRPVDGLTDQRLPLAELWQGADQLHEAMACTSDPAIRLARFAARLRRALADAPAIDRELEHAIARLTADPQLRVATLARELGRSRQHLARRFTAEVGVGPKVFARVTRLTRVVRALRRGTAPAWAALAQQHGYADQAHLVHEFDALVGLSPAAWLRSIPPIPRQTGRLPSPP
ncbi:MAG: helix-turn-helix transcriptional regulator [Deltaproteobacteria bacterium]|nr:helix-turn-helix transcriptional regulator [Nannocystaceae bacterium]